jgi:hypothetical protein
MVWIGNYLNNKIHDRYFLSTYRFSLPFALYRCNLILCSYTFQLNIHEIETPFMGLRLTFYTCVLDQSFSLTIVTFYYYDRLIFGYMSPRKLLEQSK